MLVKAFSFYVPASDTIPNTSDQILNIFTIMAIDYVDFKH